jgi:hypothetical protein
MSSRSTVPDSLPPSHPSVEKPTDGSRSSPNAPTGTVHQPHPRRPPDIDPETGRLQPISAEEWRTRQEELTRRLAEIDAQDDTPEAAYEEFRRNFDEERLRQGRPPAFEGSY